jgi:hypothetical protein
MTSRYGYASAFFSMVLSITAAGCGSSSTGGGAGGGGAGGGIGKDAASAGGGAGGTAGAGAGGVGSGGAGGGGGALDAGRDLAVSQPDASADSPIKPIDAAVPPIDAASDAPVLIGIDGGATLAQIKSLIASRCAGCHSGTGTAAARIDLTDNPDAASTLYDRLLGPVVLERYCGGNLDAGGDAAQAHRSIVPGDPSSSFFYLKITGTQPSPGSPPVNCGVRMPRVFIPAVDGGAPSSVACDSLDGGAAANCLNAADIDLVRQWILEGAPQ